MIKTKKIMYYIPKAKLTLNNNNNSSNNKITSHSKYTVMYMQSMYKKPMCSAHNADCQFYHHLHH